ncbi:MAG: hypothetical protein LM522_15055, partial [Candidatus Contendobacter sp.]|nr:hypothetical protein [Candidatus Contendobacter sp.]
MRVTLSHWIFLISGLFSPGDLVFAAESTLPPLLLHNFERVASPTPGVAMGAWSAEPGIRAGRVWYRLEPAQRPDGGRALHLHYRFTADAASDIGWQLTLPDLDATAYDHLE